MCIGGEIQAGSCAVQTHCVLVRARVQYGAGGRREGQSAAIGCSPQPSYVLPKAGGSKLCPRELWQGRIWMLKHGLSAVKVSTSFSRHFYPLHECIYHSMHSQGIKPIPLVLLVLYCPELQECLLVRRLTVNVNNGSKYVMPWNKMGNVQNRLM